MITRIGGDLFTCGIPALAHGCNCQGVMGAGIATGFRDRWPRMYVSYRARCASGEFRPGDIMPWAHDDGMIFNLATQYEPGPHAQPWMIAAAAGRMIQAAHYGFGISRIAIPEIGCGFGGLTGPDLMLALSPYARAPVDLVIVTHKPSGGAP